MPGSSSQVPPIVGAVGHSRPMNLRGPQCDTSLHEGLETRKNGGPALRDALEHGATGLEPVVDDREHYDAVADVLYVEATLERGSARQVSAVASSMPTSAAHSGVIVCQV